MSTPCRRKRESGVQAHVKSPSIEHVLHKIFQHQKEEFLRRNGME